MRRSLAWILVVAGPIAWSLAGCARSEPRAAAPDPEAEVARPMAIADQGAVELEPVAVADLPAGSTWQEARDASGTLVGIGWVCDDRPVGPWRYYHPDGSLALAGTYLYGGRRTGAWISYRPGAGPEAEIGYELDERQGPYRAWYPSGQEQVRGFHLAGQRSGRWVSWHANGQRASDGHYLRGRRVARWRFWHESGRALHGVDYR